MLEPLGDSILFTFKEEVVGGQFVSESAGGLTIYRNYNDGLQTPRWATVIAIGPDVKQDVAVGTTILIEPLKWTESFEHDDVQIWKTTFEWVMAVEE